MFPGDFKEDKHMRSKLFKVASIGITTMIGAFLSIKYLENEMDKCFNERRNSGE